MTAWLLDTGPLVAFFDRSDAAHEWAKEQCRVYRRFERQVIPLVAPT